MAIEIMYVSLETGSVKSWQDQKFRGELKGHIINSYASIDYIHAYERTAVMCAPIQFSLNT